MKTRLDDIRKLPFSQLLLGATVSELIRYSNDVPVVIKDYLLRYKEFFKSNLNHNTPSIFTELKRSLRMLNRQKNRK